ncbi:hypothetical protein B0H12DRAFT_1118769 [Mycena haematopus]|nr:hypothetical protein B0H12DRAFT_1118769 [Mycena haematopus]
MDFSTSVLKAPGVSSIRRRKPTRTYQSPSAADRAPTIAKTLSALSHQLASASASTSGSTSKSTLAQSTGTGIVVRTDTVPRKKIPNGPSSPVVPPVRPSGAVLAASEAIAFWPLSPISIDDSDSGRRSSARSRRPAAKLRDAEEDEPLSRPPISNVSAIAAVAAREIKEKASPRKRRGGGGGAGAKRKRKDADDGDATYPAKRTRNPRGMSNLLEDESPSDSMVPLPEVTLTPEPTGDQDDRRPERRSTRASNGASKRRDSNASLSTASASAVPAPPSDAEMRNNDAKDMKEEGEVSEEEGEVSEEAR